MYFTAYVYMRTNTPRREHVRIRVLRDGAHYENWPRSNGDSVGRAYANVLFNCQAAVCTVPLQSTVSHTFYAPITRVKSYIDKTI